MRSWSRWFSPTPVMPWSIPERLAELFRRLETQPPSATAEEALARICRTLDEVEDEYSGIPKRNPLPPRSEFDGRMYPPMSDSITHTPDGQLLARTRAHALEIEADGSIVIRRAATGIIEFSQSGSGG